MEPSWRAAFNAAFSDGLYRRYAARLAERLGASPAFRLAETPVFLPPELEERLVRSAHEIVAQLARPDLLEEMKGAIPAAWDAPRMDALPNVLQVDFAIVEEKDGSLGPRLIELQGFPSLSAFEVIQSDVWSECLRELPGLPEATYSPYFSGLDRERFLDLFRRVILGAHAPEDVVLLDLDPRAQKTWVDFEATRLLLGVESVDPRALVREGRRLFRDAGGRRVPVRRTYNRVVFDELIRENASLPFDFRDALDVEWVPHPNWYWTFSKASLPFLDHPAVPRAIFVSDLVEVPPDLSSRWVLKPLFSYAGGGVNVEPAPADIARIPESERGAWCVQERIEYAPCLRAADGGGVKVEIRMMFFRPDDAAELTLGLNLCRLARGKMLGVDFNRDYTWVGSSVAVRPR